MDKVAGPPYKGMQTTMVVLSTVMTSLGFVAIVLRFIARGVVVRKVGADDMFMVAGWLVTMGYLFEIWYGVRFGIGMHGTDIGSIPNMITLLKIIYAVQLTYNTAIALVKISIVCFYLRLATADGSFRIQSLATIVFLVVFYIATQVASTLQCLPISDNWNLAEGVKPKCFNTLVYFYVIAAINIVLDIWILVMPLKTLKDIRRPRRDKIVLFIIFGIGAFSCISSIVRLYTIRVYAQSTDPFYDGAPINMWSLIEVNVAIVCASVPAMKPLFTKGLRERMSKSSKNSPRYGSQGHQMYPLSGGSDGHQVPNFRDKANKNTYSARATSKYGMGGSDEQIMMKHGGIEYEREFTVEEQYIGDEPLKSAHQVHR